MMRHRSRSSPSKPRKSGWAARALLCLAALAAGPADAQVWEGLDEAPAANAAGPWTDGQSVPSWAKSVRILKQDEPILVEPRGGAARRGSAMREARLPLFALRRGPGCKEPWVGVGPHAWVCGDAVELNRATPVAVDAKSFPLANDGLPYAYHFVGSSGSLGYRRFLEVDVGQSDFTFDPGFAVAIVAERNTDGSRYGLTANEFWVPMRDLNPARPHLFQGSDIASVAATSGLEIPFGWVVAKNTRVLRAPNGFSITQENIAEFVKVEILESKGDFFRVGPDRWVAKKDVRHPTIATPPNDVDVASNEKWIDVELESQTLVAYEGKTPVFATLVSSGKGKQGAYNATPKGVERIWVKLAAANMDNLEDENANRYYRMETVPYVQFFSKGVGLHGAFWHRSFGNVRSHGCVNLAPLDAQRLFWFTSPRLPAGWTAILPTKNESGSVVRVR